MSRQVSIAKLKLLYVLEMIAAVGAGLAWGLYVQSYAVAQHEITSAQGVGAIVLAFVGARHMIALGRSGWWGIFAATGLGALVILFLPRKSSPVELRFQGRKNALAESEDDKAPKDPAERLKWQNREAPYDK